MSPEKQRIAIAEACGYTDIKRDPEYYLHRFGNTVEPLCGRIDGKYGVIPHYTADLNAMHEAEKIVPPMIDRKYEVDGEIITKSAWEDYCDNLVKINGDSYPIDATAAQRAEAFLKTIGKWEDYEELEKEQVDPDGCADET